MKYLFTLAALLSVISLGAKPAALIAVDSYGTFDTNFIINRVFHPARVEYKRFKKMPPPEQYSNFASIWVFSSCNHLNAQEIAALKKYGPCPIHRRSFIKNFIGE